MKSKETIATTEVKKPRVKKIVVNTENTETAPVKVVAKTVKKPSAKKAVQAVNAVNAIDVEVEKTPIQSAFKQIRTWNEERNLLGKEYDHNNEVSFIIEELIESTKDLTSKRARFFAKIITRLISWIPGKQTTEIQKVDAFGDVIVFATGAIEKLNYNTDLVMSEVQKELNDRTGKLIDGKFVKDYKEVKYVADLASCRYNSIKLNNFLL